MKKKQKRVIKIKIRNKKTGKENIIFMGDNYKPFEDHFLDIINSFNDKWIYDDTPERKGRCLGRTLTVDFVEMFEAKEIFPSFGGPKMIYEQNYDKHVQEHNQSGSYSACKYLKDMIFEPVDKNVLDRLLQKCHVIIKETNKTI